jgi:hypothetical protein
MHPPPNHQQDAPLYDSDQPLEFPEDDELQLYFDHSVKYHKKGRWNRRLTYAGGCPQVNRCDNGRPVPLFPELAVSRTRAHLDGELWLSLYPGRMVGHNVIDYDGKMACGHVREGGDLRPVCCPDVPWLLGLKRLMDAFPDRIVCIPSATLGVHLWRRYPLVTTWYVHERIGRELEATGVKAEVFPDPSRPFRRPFGRDYRTITPHGILADWREQLAYYLDDDRQPPDFPTVVRSFVQVVDDEVARARKAPTTFDKTGRPGRIDFRTIAERLTVIEGWLNTGCPDWQEPREEVVEAGVKGDGDRLHDVLPGFSSSVVLSPSGRTPHLRSGEWAKGLEYLAIHGLQEPDSVGPVLYEMASYLYWIELFNLPAGERRRRIVELLKTFVRTKHNGMVDLLSNGHENQVMRQVERAARAVTKDRHAGCLEHFARIRQRRDRGQYAHVINLALLMQGEEQAQVTHIPGFYYSVPLRRDDSPAPEPVETDLLRIAESRRMRRRAGEYPFVRFARRLLNILWANNGHARINRDDLLTLTDSGSHDQLVRYRESLVRAGVLEPFRGSYRVRTAASLYRMTALTRRAYESRYEALTRPRAC